MDAAVIGRRRFLAGAIAAAVAAALPACTRPQPTAAKGAASAVWTDLLERMFQAQVRDFPELLSSHGLDRGELRSARHRLGDRSATARARYLSEQRAFLLELDAIDAQGLDADAAIGLRAVRWLCASYVQGGRYGYGQAQVSRPYALSQIDGAHVDVPALLVEASHWIEDGDDVEAYLSRLAALPTAMDQDMERAREDAARGVLPPRPLIATALTNLSALRDTPPAELAFVAALSRTTVGMPQARDWRTRAVGIAQGPWRTALQAQIALLESWQARATETPGVARLPDGEAYYRWALQHNATAPVDPAELHRQGHEQLAELSARMDSILRAQGLSEGSVGRRYLALAQRPQHRYANTDADKARLLTDMQARVRDLRPRLPRYFDALPPFHPDPRQLPPLAETLRNPDGPRWEIVSHFNHEVLGHYLQVERALQLRVPMLINATNLPAFHEGWGLYAEQLAGAMGIDADDPLAMLGHLRSLRARAMNLVADTGLHAQGWSRERTATFIAETGGLPIAAAQARADRHSASPGQGVAFKCGHNAWSELRLRAQAALGAKFDLGRFHDAGLRHGAIPMAVLESAIDEWIAAGGV